MERPEDAVAWMNAIWDRKQALWAEGEAAAALSHRLRLPATLAGIGDDLGDEAGAEECHATADGPSSTEAGAGGADSTGAGGLAADDGVADAEAAQQRAATEEAAMRQLEQALSEASAVPPGLEEQDAANTELLQLIVAYAEQLVLVPWLGFMLRCAHTCAAESFPLPTLEVNLRRSASLRQDAALWGLNTKVSKRSPLAAPPPPARLHCLQVFVECRGGPCPLPATELSHPSMLNARVRCGLAALDVTAALPPGAGPLCLGVERGDGGAGWAAALLREGGCQVGVDGVDGPGCARSEGGLPLPSVPDADGHPRCDQRDLHRGAHLQGGRRHGAAGARG
jgi:hypothetical protein